jgi:hypothetical protein
MWSLLDFWRVILDLLVAGLQSLRFSFRKWRSRSWPVTSGTVQPCSVEKGKGIWALGPYRSVFGYAFVAKESRYAGFFALHADDEETAEMLQKQAEGTGVTVRYDSENPDVCLLEDEWIFERKVIQNPHWLP